MIKYSVLMSVYFKEKSGFLKLSLDSMINQTLPPDEIVLVEDGVLTEELYKVVDEYKMLYPKLFKIVKNEKNLGLGLALNKGLINCSNEYVVRMDTDDIAELDRCEQEINCLIKNDVDLVGSIIDEYDETMTNKICSRVVPETNEDIYMYLKKRCPFNHQTVLFKKKSILEAGSYQDLLYNEDYLLWITMAMQNCKFYNIQKPLVKVRTSKDLYMRRGGIKYYKSEKKIQKILYKNKFINYFQYKKGCMVRFVFQVLLTKKIRSILYINLLRRKK